MNLKASSNKKIADLLRRCLRFPEHCPAPVLLPEIFTDEVVRLFIPSAAYVPYALSRQPSTKLYTFYAIIISHKPGFGKHFFDIFIFEKSRSELAFSIICQ